MTDRKTRFLLAKQLEADGRIADALERLAKAVEENGSASPHQTPPLTSNKQGLSQ